MELPLVLLSLLLFGYAVRQAIRQRRLRRAGVRTTGVVSHVLRSQTHHPVVRFVDEQRRGHEFLIRFFRADSLPVGDRVPVVYLPGEPASARIDLASRRRLAVGLPLAGGVVTAACVLGKESVSPELLLLLGALLPIAWAAHEATHQLRLSRKGIRTEGLVVRHKSESGGEGGSVILPVVRFADEQGHAHECRGGGGKGPLPVGTRVPVRYLPGAPASARIALASQRALAVGGPLLVGVLLAVTAVAEMCR